MKTHADYAHLQPTAATVAQKSDAERIRYLKAERWIGYPRAMQAVHELEDLLAMPKRDRMPNLLIVGPTNIGKTVIIRRFCRDHRRVSELGRERIPVLAMQMPAVPTLARFYTALLDATEAPFSNNGRAADLERVAVRVLRTTGVRVLIIDELHNILAAPTAVRHTFLNVLRSLGNELQIPLVGVGTRDAYLAVASDPQLENRFRPFVLPLWKPDDEMLGLLASFERMLPLRRPSSIANESMAEYLLDRSGGTIGELSSLLVAASVTAITSGDECINQRSLAAAAYVGPKLRRQQVKDL